MSIKYFCDKCGKEVNIMDIMSIETKWKTSQFEEGNALKKAYMCDECKKEYYNKMQEIKEVFGFRTYI